MSLEFKNKESFLKEIEDYIRINDSTILEAIVDYQQRYELDEDYISNNLMSAGLYESLLEESKKFNLLKKEEDLNHDLF